MIPEFYNILEPVIKEGDLELLSEVINHFSKNPDWMTIGVVILHVAAENERDGIIKFVVDKCPELLKSPDLRCKLRILLTLIMDLNVDAVEIILKTDFLIDDHIKFDAVLGIAYNLYNSPIVNNADTKKVKKIIKLLIEYSYNNFNKYDVTLKVNEETLNIEALIKSECDFNTIYGTQTFMEIIVFYISYYKSLDDPIQQLSYSKVVDIYYFIGKLFIKKIVFLRDLNSHVSENIINAINNDCKLKSFKEQCEEELNRMKSDLVDKTTVTAYGIATASINKLVKFMCNRNLKEFIVSNKSVVNYPIYAATIRHRFELSQKRQKLLKISESVFKSTYGNLPELPPECISIILDKCSDNDLINFIDRNRKH